MNLQNKIRVGLLLLTLFLVSINVSAQDIKTTQTPSLKFDNLIIPGDRIGPVSMGGDVKEIVDKIGNPKKISRSTFRGPGYDADEVYYWYGHQYQLTFVWIDKGLSPVVESGFRGITTTSNYWATAKGIHVGSSIQDVENAYGNPDDFSLHEADHTYMMSYNKIGIWFTVKDRNSPVKYISVIPVNNY